MKFSEYLKEVAWYQQGKDPGDIPTKGWKPEGPKTSGGTHDFKHPSGWKAAVYRQGGMVYYKIQDPKGETFTTFHGPSGTSIVSPDKFFAEKIKEMEKSTSKK